MNVNKEKMNPHPHPSSLKKDNNHLEIFRKPAIIVLIDVICFIASIRIDQPIFSVKYDKLEALSTRLNSQSHCLVFKRSDFIFILFQILFITHISN